MDRLLSSNALLLRYACHSGRAAAPSCGGSRSWSSAQRAICSGRPTKCRNSVAAARWDAPLSTLDAASATPRAQRVPTQEMSEPARVPAVDPGYAITSTPAKASTMPAPKRSQAAMSRSSKGSMSLSSIIALASNQRSVRRAPSTKGTA